MLATTLHNRYDKDVLILQAKIASAC
jgi:hypothetical protein